MRARPGISVHREDTQREAEAYEAGIARGIEMAAVFCDSRGHGAAAADLRAATIEAGEPAEAVAAE